MSWLNNFMRAKELFLTEQTGQSKLIKDLDHIWIWEVPHSKYKEYLKQDVLDDSGKRPNPHYRLYFVSSKSTYDRKEINPDNVGDYDRVILFQVIDNDFITIGGYFKFDAPDFKKIAKIFNIVNAPGLDLGRKVFYKGAVSKTKDNWQLFSQPDLKDGSKVHKVPGPLLWLVGWESREPAQIAYVVETSYAGEFTLVVKGHLVQLAHFDKESHKVLAALKELCAREKIQIDPKYLPDVPPPREINIKPGSNMHRMLAFVADHPGSSRSDWYVHHLGLSGQGMPGWTSEKSSDGVAARLGWLTNSGTQGKYSLTITPVGKLILARLNAGYTVKTNVNA